MFNNAFRNECTTANWIFNVVVLEHRRKSMIHEQLIYPNLDFKILDYFLTLSSRNPDLQP